MNKDTSYIGKWHIGEIPRKKFINENERLGFQYWRGHECNHNYMQGYYDDNDDHRHMIDGYAPIGEMDLALEYLENRSADEENAGPFALFVNYGIPHDPYFLLAEGKLEKYENRDLKLRENVEELRATENPEGFVSPRKALAGYYAHIEQLDRQIGRLLDYLDSHGLGEDTLVVYTSDHGDMLGSHGYLKKQIYFEESARVPMLLRWPGRLVPGEREACIGSADLAPTVLGMLGCGFSSTVDGGDLSGIALDASADRVRPVYFYNYVPCHNAAKRVYEGSWRAVSDGAYMLAVTQSEEILGFYHLTEDPLQLHDLSRDPEQHTALEKYRALLNEFVSANDGYKPWEELLAENGLKDAWDASEEHFFGKTVSSRG